MLHIPRITDSPDGGSELRKRKHPETTLCNEGSEYTGFQESCKTKPRKVFSASRINRIATPRLPPSHAAGSSVHMKLHAKTPGRQTGLCVIESAFVFP